jgi:hypothetical protein
MPVSLPACSSASVSLPTLTGLGAGVGQQLADHLDAAGRAETVR